LGLKEKSLQQELEVDMKKQLPVVLSVGDRQRKLKARMRIAYAILSWLKILWWIWTSWTFPFTNYVHQTAQ
jgi:hypothetical protein